VGANNYIIILSNNSIKSVSWVSVMFWKEQEDSIMMTASPLET
jgi:hypothetical protein